MNKTMKNAEFMEAAIKLALKAEGFTSPNPMVGCVVVKSGKIISSGYHKRPGMPHAEREALLKAGKRAKGADLYVNLEPCCHFGRTPPCTDIIIKSGIRRVFAAMRDPNPLVSGKGFKLLKKSGIRVEAGLLRREAETLNRFFIKNKKEERPYFILKAGMSADGKMALKNGKSKWITSKESRLDAQKLRKNCDAILVGINTVLADNPYLDCRVAPEKRIKKVILDSNGRIPEDANVFKKSEPRDIFVFTSYMRMAKINRLVKRGVNVIITDRTKRGVDEKVVASSLFKLGVMSVLVEGGSLTAASFLKERLVDEAHLYIAPSIIGSDGLGFFGDMGFKGMREILRLEDTSVKRIKNDILLEGRIKYV
ncbi:MAG TPA: bifunctional diaminohydroxyphosphoribosylaminopyrimidine deaminase/5-amino-6-(5-phosphoribosylamino)uracil reductase RibD [bacterium]|nr:bifunctional diaminohydroxyphosphoribosylaminopyrimidine deaminase/5-amino-6-(5-phosphoribosylamino)uracil reductase RibD [bacterium]